MGMESDSRWWPWLLSLGFHALLMFGMASIVILEDVPDSSEGLAQVYFRDQQGLSLHSESEVVYRGRSQSIPENVSLLIGEDGNRPLMGPSEANGDFTNRCQLPSSTTPW